MTFKGLKIAAVAAAFSVLAFMPVQSQAAVIVDTTIGNDGSRLSFGNFGPGFNQNPLGQSFSIAETVRNLSIGAIFEDVNMTGAPSFDVTISLLSGAGTGGSVLGSSLLTLDDGFEGFRAVDFSFVGDLIAGTYTALFSSGFLNRGSIGVSTADQGDPNSSPFNDEGQLTLFDEPERDFAVWISGDFDMPQIAVPEPASLALLGMGLFGLAAIRRRRQRS